MPKVVFLDMGLDERMLIIRRNDFLAQLTNEEYESLNILHNVVVADRNEYVYFDAQYLDKLFFVKEGYIKIGNTDDEGNEIVKDILQPGDVFGQFTLEKENMQGEFAQAYKTEAALCAFTIQDFGTLLHKKPELAVQFSKKVGHQLKRIDNRLINLLQKDARTRLLYFFWTLLQHKQVVAAGQLSIENYFTHEDIARLTGTSRQTVTTLISQFEDEGLLEVDRKSIVIHDIKQLQKQAKIG